MAKQTSSSSKTVTVKSGETEVTYKVSYLKMPEPTREEGANPPRTSLKHPSYKLMQDPK